jgi:exosortase E/protease (VPEID-CTERM system)
MHPAQADTNAHPIPTGQQLKLRIFILFGVTAVEALRSFVNIGPERSSLARWLVAFCMIFLSLTYRRVMTNLRGVKSKVALPPISWVFGIPHLVSLVALSLISKQMVVAHSDVALAILAVIWFAALVAGVAFAGLVTLPLTIWRAIGRDTGRFCLPAAAGAGLICYVTPLLWRQWDGSQWDFAIEVTFWLVNLLLRGVLPSIVADPVKHIIGSERFSVTIEGACSGWEGLALTCVFGALWLWFSRGRYRFPRALILIPAAMMAMFCLNSFRIAALVLIGHFGSPVVAMTGFHSQSGWIAFNVVAFGMALVSYRIPWLAAGTADAPGAGVENPNVPYLLPLFTITAAGMIARAASGTFEWLYPLRLISGAAALWFCRRQYRSLRWRPGLLSVVAGVAVFVVWIAMEPANHAPSVLPGALATLSTAMRFAWIGCRLAGAVLIVPIAEELAFRGFLLRRLISTDFESVVSPRHAWMGLLVSSFLFGVLHGDRWIAASIAGAVYGAVMLRRGRIADAVVAHATTNALLSWAVLGGGEWFFW